MPSRGKLKSSAAVAAIDIPVATFNRWLDRKLIPLSPDDIPGDGRGRPRRFGLRTITKCAIAHKISLLGIPANIAVRMASLFTDGRQQGRLFPVGLTYIVATPDGKAIIKNIMPEEDVTALLKDATLLVNVNDIVSNIKLPIGEIQ